MKNQQSTIKNFQMFFTRFYIIFWLSILSVISLHAQVNEKQDLALDYYKNKEFNKAAALFQELYQQQKSSFYFTYYIASLSQSGDYETAEKAIKKEIKRNPDDLTFKVMLGNIYKQLNRMDDMKKTYDDVLKSLGPNQSQLFQVANMFMANQEYTMAESVYVKGQKLLKGSYSFHIELASLYQMQKLYDKMIDEYLSLLSENRDMIQMVQNRLQQNVYSSEEKALTTLLQEKLIRQIQKNPDATIFSELLIWLYTQQNQFDKALTFSIAIDKRQKEDGNRVFSLGTIAFSNKDYNTSLKAFQYIIDKGDRCSWYFEAQQNYLITLYQQTIEDPQIQRTKIMELEKLLQNYLDAQGLSKNSFSVAKALAKVKALYLNKYDEAISLLKKILENSSAFSSQQQSETKMLLGDIMLITNDIWEATLLYTQVEKSNANEPIAHEAKFKKAMLAYYSGDFLWAQAQVDVLKASTSKLIANDAFALSQFISENLEADSTQRSLQLFSKADYCIFKNQDSIAMLYLDTVLNTKDAYSLFDDAFLKKADIYVLLKKYDAAITLYDSVITRFPQEVSAPQAAYKLATLFQNQLQNKEKAMHYYELLFTHYPGSFFADESRKQFRILRGDMIETDETKEISPESIP